MFHHGWHTHTDDRGFARKRGPGGPFGFWHALEERRHAHHGFGGGRERLLDAGDIKLVVLKLLSEEPGYGYQLIKRMEDRLAGGYTPSPGIIYPTLTLLEEEGLLTSTTEGSKKVFAITAEGEAFLKGNRRQVNALFERLEEAGRGFERGRSPEIMKAFMNLRASVVAHASRDSMTQTQIKKIAEIINDAVRQIDEL